MTSPRRSKPIKVSHQTLLKRRHLPMPRATEAEQDGKAKSRRKRLKAYPLIPDDRCANPDGEWPPI